MRTARGHKALPLRRTYINMSIKNNNLLLVLLLLAGCKQVPQVTVPTLPGLGPHKIDIQQGNVITQEMIDKLQPGMTRNQVRFILGTPLLVDPFRTDRWDYVYSMKKGGEVIEQRQLKVFFADDKMVRVEGDTSDTKAAALAAAKPVAAPAVAPKVEPVAVASKPAPVPIEVGKPQLQVAPSPGEPAKPEEIKAAQAAASTVAGAPVTSAAGEGMTAPPLDAPPMPRLEIKGESTEPASPFAVAPAAAPAPDTPARADVAATPAKPAADSKPAQKPEVQPGFFGRLFGRTPAEREQKPVAQPAQTAKPSPEQPVIVFAPVAKPEAKPESPAPKPVPSAPAPTITAAPAPVEKPVEKAVAATPEQKPADKAAEKPAATAQRGFFGRLLDAAANPAPPIRQGGERIAEPGSPPPPFVDPKPAPVKP